MKKIVAIVLALCMLLVLFTACRPSENANNSGTGGGGSGGGSSNGGGSGGGSGGGEEEDDGHDEITEIQFWWTASGNYGDSPGTPAVVDALNKYLEESIRVRVHFHWISGGDYATQVSLAIANQEIVDMVSCTPQPAGSFLTFYSNGILKDMSPYIDEYAPELKALFGTELLNATTIDGKLFGLSTYRILNSNFYIAFREDVLEELDILDKALNMTTWAEYEEIMDAITNQSEIVQYGTGHGDRTLFGDRGTFWFGEKFSDCYSYDMLGDALGLIWTDQEGHVENGMARFEVVEQCKMAADWMAKGYVYPDTAYSQDGTETLCGQGVYGSFPIQSEFGVDVNKSQTVGRKMRCPEVVPGILTTTQCQKFSCGMGATSAEPEATMKFINALYTDPVVMNLIIYGIENENYYVKDGEAFYPEGTDSSTCGYHAMGFALGNQFLLWPWDGEGANFRADAMENFLNCRKSIYLGLSVDTSKYDQLVAAVYAVEEEYWGQMSSGYYTDDMYNEFMTKLNAAGVNDYVAIFQKAVDDFLA